MEHLEPDNKNSNFVWWQGVVEDIEDPLKLGRCRVRIFGIHTPDKSEIPTESLPWAHPLMPYNSASMSGVGISPTGILPGSWVMGFFQDGESCQQPVILGSYGGINRLQGINNGDPSIGFNDPLGKFPRNLYVDEPDTNKLARNEDISNTIVKKKRDGVDTCNPTALGGNWSEPATPYNAKYTKNHVVESESGHIFEVDDTPGSERIHQYHRTGTFEEIHPDGSKVEKIVGDSYEIVKKNNHVSIYGNLNVNVGDTIKIYSGKNFDIQVGGNARIHVAGNTTMQTDGNFLHKIGGSTRIISGGNMTLVAPRIDLNPSGVSPRSGNPGFRLNKSCPKNTTRTYSNGGVQLSLEDGSVVTVERGRKLFTSNRGWVSAESLSENDDIVLGKSGIS